MREALEEVGLCSSLLVQSSVSGGTHLYYPLPDAYPTYHVAALIQTTLIDAGFEIANGQLEIFPNCKGYAKRKGEYIHYKRHRLPLQPRSESYLLDEEGNPQLILPTVEAQVAAFLDQWQWCAQKQDRDLLEKNLPSAYKKYKQAKNRRKYQRKEDKSPTANTWEASLDLAIQTGWTGFHQTQILVRQILQKGVVFLHLEGQKLIDWGVETLTNMPGFRQYCRHQPEIHKIFKSWVKTNERTRYYQPYCSHPERAERYPFDSQKKSRQGQPPTNPSYEAQKKIARHRIRTAYGCLLPTLTPEMKIAELREAIRQQTKKRFGVTCSNNTLTRNKDLWHPALCPLPSALPEELVNLTTLTQTESKELKSNQSKDFAESELDSAIELKTPENQAPSELDQPHPPMICVPHDAPLKNLDPPHSRAAHDEQQSEVHHPTNPPQPQGKFEVLGDLLAKIIGLAALVINLGVGAEVSGSAPSTAAAETTPTHLNQPPTSSSSRSTPSTETEIPTQTDPIEPTDPPPPCQNPRIPSIRLLEYDPNRIGVPWTSQAELDKFAGYLVLIAKQERGIDNPYAWATKALKNLKENRINRRWLEFTGDRMIAPDSPEAAVVRNLFGHPQTANFQHLSTPLQEPSPLEPLNSPPSTEDLDSEQVQLSQVGMKVRRIPHRYGGKDYPEIRGEISGGSAQGYQVKTESGSQYCFALCDWNNTWELVECHSEPERDLEVNGQLSPPELVKGARVTIAATGQVGVVMWIWSGKIAQNFDQTVRVWVDDLNRMVACNPSDLICYPE